MQFHTLKWRRGKLFLLDQRKLPSRKILVACDCCGDVARAIRNMTVRGAPAIGVAAAFGMALGARCSKEKNPDLLMREIEAVGRMLAGTRPTAVNLLWAVKRMNDTARKSLPKGRAALIRKMEKEAEKILAEDVRANREMGRQGRVLLPDGSSVLTHCNAGALATAGYGTALGVIRAAFESGKRVHVFVDETRPFLQGARLTAWELMQNRIPCTLITDNMAGALMAQGKIDLAIVGADRIAANGDVANKIGTYSVARLCHVHRIPFYVAAPVSTVDLSTPKGERIPIEQRPATEVTSVLRRTIAPRGVKVWNPAFDVTPHRYITAIITEKGIVRAPCKSGLKKLFGQ